MSMEHIFRNINDTRVFDLFAEMGFGKDDCIDIYDVIELLECGEIERIQIEDSIEHLIKERVLSVELINEEYRLEHYYLCDNNLVKCLVSAVLESSFLEAEKIENIKLIENKINMNNPIIGQRIHVYSNNYEDFGLGTIVDLDILESDTGDIITNNYVYIKLDNGKILEHLNCMWYPIDEEGE